MKQHMIGLGFVFVVALGIAAPGLAQEAVQWRVEDGGNGHWYRVRGAETRSWSQWSDYAASIGGHLATITSSTERDFVQPLVRDGIPLNQGAVLGARQNTSDPGFSEPAGGWSWVTGEDWSWTNWSVWAGNPSNSPYGPCGCENFLSLGRWSWTEDGIANWNDYNGELPMLVHAVVEWSADCNGDGVVDYGQCRDGSLPDYDGDNIPDCCEAGTPCTVGSYPVQWRVEDGGNGHWFQYTQSKQAESWSDGLTRCTAAGGHLVTLANAAEDDFVRSRILAGRVGQYEFGPFIGGYKDVTVSEPDSACIGWHWITGEPFAYIQDAALCGVWANYYPFEDRLHYWIGEQLVWNNTVVDTPVRHRLIEWSADCNADGIVDYGQILQGQLVDADSNGVPDICEVDSCPGDITGGGVVDGTDLAALLSAWGTNGQGKFTTDLNDDGTVDAGDLSIVLAGWGPCPD